jgi:hypothetical protein
MTDIFSGAIFHDWFETGEPELPDELGNWPDNLSK